MKKATEMPSSEKDPWMVRVLSISKLYPEVKKAYDQAELSRQQELEKQLKGIKEELWEAFLVNEQNFEVAIIDIYAVDVLQKISEVMAKITK